MDYVYSRLLEDFYRINRECAASAILAQLLESPAYLRVFLDEAGLSWKEGVATARCEYPLGDGGRADVFVEWASATARYSLYIENKPSTGFHHKQPGNYIAQLIKHEEEKRHTAFILLYYDKSLLDDATTRLRQQRRVSTWATGDTWPVLDQKLREHRPGAWMRHAGLRELCAALNKVVAPAPYPDLAAFLRYRYDTAEAEIPQPWRAPVDALLESLDAGSAAHLTESYGQTIWGTGSSRHRRYLWLGLMPRVAAELRHTGDTLLLYRAGKFSSQEQKLLDSALGTRAWAPIQSGEELHEEAIIFPPADLPALQKLIRSLDRLDAD